MSYIKKDVSPKNTEYSKIQSGAIDPLLFDTGSVYEGFKVPDPWANDYDFKNVYNVENNHPFVIETVTRLNNFGYRSDDFTSEHDGKHILFLGCSVTWGDGLKEDELWSKKLYDQISTKVKCSGYFNLSLLATGISEIVYSVNSYVQRFGMPDMIFINLPNLYRFYGIEMKNNDLLNTIELSLSKTSGDRLPPERSGSRQMTESSKMLTRYITLRNLEMLETMCAIANTDLYTFTWDNKSREDLQADLESCGFKSFHSFDPSEIEEAVFELDMTNKDEFGIKARDNSHYGSYYHTVWANKIMKDIEGNL